MGDCIMQNTGVDIFATKGIEYLLVLGFLPLLTLFWKFLNRSKTPAKASEASDESTISEPSNSNGGA